MSRSRPATNIVVMRGTPDPRRSGRRHQLTATTRTPCAAQPDWAVADRTPCANADPELWFAEQPAELNLAKALCAHCPIKAACLAGALDRGEPWGVWGGEIVRQGVVMAYKRGRGRPSNADRRLGLITRVAGQPAREFTRPGTTETFHSRSA